MLKITPNESFAKIFKYESSDIKPGNIFCPPFGKLLAPTKREKLKKTLKASLLMLIEFEKHWSSGLLSKYGL